MYLRRCMVAMGFGVVLLLSSCASQLKTPRSTIDFSVKMPLQRRMALRAINVWRANGAFSIQQITQTTQQSNIATYRWAQFGVHHYRVDIASTLGLYRLSIRHYAHHVALWKNGVRLYSANTVDHLMQKAVGWSLPVRQLADWLKGVPARHALYAAKYDHFGHLVALQQAGWTVNYGSYLVMRPGIDLPQVIVMQRPGLHIKIVVKQWLLL